MITQLELIAHLEIDLANPDLKEGYDARIADGQTHEEIIAGLNAMLTQCFTELMNEEFSEEGMNVTVEVR